MHRLLLVVVLAVALLGTDARFVRRGRAERRPSSSTSFVGDATNQLSTAILQGYIDDNKNIAFSPLGYAAILAILAEGAKGTTREQLVNALHLPNDSELTRNTFRHIMERLKNTHDYKFNTPELKNYFYIYKNYTINDDYKKILENYYLTEVRSVERYHAETAVNIESRKENEKEEFTVDLSEKNPGDENAEIPELLPPNSSNEKLIIFAVEAKPETIIPSADKPAKNIKEKIKLIKTGGKKEETGDDEETMVAVEARNHARSLKVLEDKNDVSSIISVNSVGKKSNGVPSASNSLMIIFNGMYFRGSWKQPFKIVEPSTFYQSSTEKKLVPMMKATGIFKTGYLSGLDSVALELPYDGGRYSLLLVVPRSRDGLIRLTADLPAASLSEIQDSLEEEELSIAVPTFYVETTTKPVAALAKFGVSTIFSRDAELSGVSSTEGLFVQELVQHVAVRVDNADASASELTAGNPSLEALKNLPATNLKTPRKFNVEHPFMFFIMDRLDNLVVVAGKVVDPEQQSTNQM